MIKPRHLLHPLRAVRIVRTRLLAHLNMRLFAARSVRQFKGDPRYDLRNVTDGFASRFHDTGDDVTLLERICTAYTKAVADQPSASASYEPTEWWHQLRASALRPVLRALRDGDTAALRPMYAGFFRDPCAAGLIAAPYGMSKAFFQGPIRDVYRHGCMGDALYRLDYWAEQTGGRFERATLAGPDTGNPFGVSIQGTLVRTGSEYQHYCAHRILNQLNSKQCVVAEIGGGYGGMAYYLLRDAGTLTYLDFDVPESIALTSYYLMKTFPSLRFLLYGEKDLTKEAIAVSDVALMPLFAMAQMPPDSVELTFSSHAMSDLSHDAMVEYLDNIAHMTRNFFLHIGHGRAADMLSKLTTRSYRHFNPVGTRPSGWNRHKAAKATEVECLYRLNPPV
jgi:hypothetical protein